MAIIIDPNKAAPTPEAAPPRPAMPSVETVIAAICVDPMAAYRQRKFGSKICQCGKRVSSNAFACRECSLIYLDKAITDIDNQVAKLVGSGDFEAANNYLKAQTKLQQMRADVHKANGRKKM